MRKHGNAVKKSDLRYQIFMSILYTSVRTDQTGIYTWPLHASLMLSNWAFCINVWLHKCVATKQTLPALMQLKLAHFRCNNNTLFCPYGSKCLRFAVATSISPVIAYSCVDYRASNLLYADILPVGRSKLAYVAWTSRCLHLKYTLKTGLQCILNVSWKTLTLGLLMIE